MGLEAYICAMGPHKPPKYQIQLIKIKPRGLYTSLVYEKQKRVAGQLFLSFCIDIKGDKGRKYVFWGVFCISRGQSESQNKNNTKNKNKNKIYFLSEKVCLNLFLELKSEPDSP
jgi:hypothetical protein